jgi:hypothetical protein
MNGPEILRLIRHDLQRAVAERGEPPTPQPIAASPCVAMSAMQKAIRRGREDLAGNEPSKERRLQRRVATPGRPGSKR